MSTTFENVKVGDKVWSLIEGRKVEVDHIDPLGFGAGAWRYRKTGAVYGCPDGPQIIFWRKPDVLPVAPERPKRKVTKTVDGWVNVYANGVCRRLYETEDEAATNRRREEYASDTGLRHPIVIVHLTGTYEVEE